MTCYHDKRNKSIKVFIEYTKRIYTIKVTKLLRIEGFVMNSFPEVNYAKWQEIKIKRNNDARQ